MSNVIVYLPLILDGLWITVSLSLVSLCFATLIGLGGALCRLSSHYWLSKISRVYIVVVRGIPDLVLMLLIFFGVHKLINDFGFWAGLWDYVDLNKFWTGAFTIGIIFGAYMTETFRGGFLAIDRGQIEAAQAFGMSSFSVFKSVSFPQLVFYTLPGFTNNWLVLMKTTALVSVIGLGDVVYNSFVAGRTVREPFTFFLVAMCTYLLITCISDILLAILSRRYCGWSRVIR